jgi:acetyltransferase
MFDPFFSPRAVAVIGASPTAEKIGTIVMKNILDGGFAGGVHPVNPRGGEILGRPVSRSIEELPPEVDMAVICVPAPGVRDAVAQLGRKGIRHAVVITAGFREAGHEGAELEKELLSTAVDHGVRLIGPNCLGVIDPHSRLNATFSDKMPNPGHIAFVSQSGAVCVAILDWALLSGVGFSKFVSMGNKLDVDEVTLFQYLAEDPKTRVISAYLESVGRGRAFLEQVPQVSRRKPVVVFKAGTSQAGAKAASSHTGALAGSDLAFDAACARAGILRAPTMEQIFDFALAFSEGRNMAGPRVLMVTNSGGPGVIATDQVEKTALSMAEPTAAQKDVLRRILPAAAGLNNPIDVIGDSDRARFANTLDAVATFDGVDGFLVIFTPTSALTGAEVAVEVERFYRRHDKPVVVVLLGGESIEGAARDLVRAGIATVGSPERGIDALDALWRYRRWQDRDFGPARPEIPSRERAERLLAYAIERGSTYLPEQDARSVLSAYGVRFNKSIVAARELEAVMVAGNLGYPVVMKIVSPDIVHKSDVGGVKVGLKSAADVFSGFETMMRTVREKAPAARIVGAAVQEMVPGGVEVIIGALRDPQFGPLIMFGLGGVFVEAMKDVTFRLAPLSREEAWEMLDAIRSGAMLRGIRGTPPADREALVDLLLRVSSFIADFPDVTELDLNPVKVLPEGKGVVAVDARISLRGANV